MTWEHAQTISNAAAAGRLELDVVAVWPIQLLFRICHRQCMLYDDLLIPGFAVDQLNRKIFGAESICTNPGSHINPLAKTELPIALPFHVQLQSWPGLPYFVLPGSYGTYLFVIVLCDFYAFLNRRHVIAGGVFLQHASHTESGSACPNSLFHDRNPAMRDTIIPPVIVGRNDLVLEQGIQGEAIGLILRVRIVIFACLANRPAVPAIVTLGPPAVQDAAIWLPVERCFLAAGTTGFVRTDGVVQPEIGSGNHVPSQLDIIVFQENDLAPECIAAREPVNLLDEGFTRPIGRMGFSRKDNLHGRFGIVQDAPQALGAAEDQRGALICGEAPG